MKIKRAFQLVEELATIGFDSYCDDMSETEEAEYREAIDKLWQEMESRVRSNIPVMDSLQKALEWQEALNWLRSKDKWQ